MILERTREHWRSNDTPPNNTIDSDYAKKKRKQRSKFGKDLKIEIEDRDMTDNSLSA